MLAIIDYGMGNLRSIQNALNYLGFPNTVTNSHEKILKSERLILPGVGSFYEAMKNINQQGLLPVINKAVIEQKKPILGICLGMQLLAERGDEDGPSSGLDLIQGGVHKFPARKLKVRLPHIGWNEVRCKDNSVLFEGVEESDFYFVHSYRLVCKDKEDVVATSWYGEEFAVAVQKNNIFGTQFHPEKSQSNGLRVLKNFCEYGR